MKNNILFSIITVNFNSGKDLEKTIKSVINQKSKNYEYIVIDGGSTDEFLDAIKRYENDITYWVSEKDKGIYEAMNKGIKVSNGDLIFFLNAGDTFSDSHVLEDVEKFYNKSDKPLCLYGGINYINPFTDIKYSETLNEEITIDMIKRGKMIRHQSLFVSKSVFNDLGNFDIKYRLGGDFEFECRLFQKNISCLHINRIISNFYGGGRGSNLYKSYIEKSVIIKDKFGSYYYIRYFLHRGVYLLMIYLLDLTRTKKTILRIRSKFLKKQSKNIDKRL